MPHAISPIGAAVRATVPPLGPTFDFSNDQCIRRGARHRVAVDRCARRLGHLIIPAAVLVAGLAAARSSAAQVAPGAAPPDTLTLSLAEVQRLAVRQNLSFLAARQETAIAGGELRQARVYRFNPDLALQATGVAPR